MPMMDDLVANLTDALAAHNDHHRDVASSDLEGRRETYPPPPGAAHGAPPALLPADGHQ